MFSDSSASIAPHHKLGIIRGEWLPDWGDEGYCEYVASESSFPNAEGLRCFADGDSETMNHSQSNVIFWRGTSRA